MTRLKPNARYRLLRRWALRSGAIQRALRRIESGVGAWTGSILDRTLSDAQKEALSIDLYDASFRPHNDHDGLYPWETRWFHRRLPPPPASVLVGAAGAGREAAALRTSGYRIHAFEPASSAFRRCERVLGSDRVDQASYRDLVAATLHDESTRLRITADSRFDAVLLGWGSFGHVLRREQRFDLLRACDRLAPRGPILLSLFEPKGASAVGESYYTWWGGFLCQPTVDELDQSASSLHRKLIVSLQPPTSYATLVPDGP